MSKNTGTSELINYFDLGANGDVGIAGSLDINTIANATTDTDTFLVSDTGIIKYRTGAQLLSDIGAAPAVAGGYVPYTGATTNVDLGIYNLTTSAIIANGSGSNSGIVHLESNAIHSLVNGYGSIASGTTNQFNLYQTTGAGVFRGAILSLNSITASATRTFTLPDADGTIALTSSLSGYLPLTGGTLTGALNGTSATFSTEVTSSGGQGRFGGWATGAGYQGNALEVGVSGGNAFMIGYNRTSGSYIPLSIGGTTNQTTTIGGSSIVFQNNGVTALTIASTGAATFSSSVTTSQLVSLSPSGTAALFLKDASANNKWEIGHITNNLYFYNYTTGTNPLVITGATGAATFSSSAAGQAIFDSTNASGGYIGFRRSGTSIGYLGNSAQLGQGILNALELRADNNLFLTTTSGLFTMTSGGNVGIGTSSINASSGYKMLRINGATTGAEIVLAGAEVEYGYMYASAGIFVIDALASQPMRFRTGTQNRMEISSSGAITMSVPTNGQTLTVFGKNNNWCEEIVGSSTTGQSYGLLVTAGTNSADYSFYVQNQPGTSPSFRVRGDSLVAFPKINDFTTGNSPNTWINPASSYGIYINTSSIRYKKDVVNYDKGLTVVNQLRPVYYKGTSEVDGNKQFAGFIAEEIDELGLTEFVNYLEDGRPNSLSYPNMIVLLTKAIQEQQVQIDKLKNS